MWECVTPTGVTSGQQKYEDKSGENDIDSVFLQNGDATCSRSIALLKRIAGLCNERFS